MTGTRAEPVSLTGPAVEQFLELMPDAIVAINREGEIVLTNHLAETLFGYETGDLLGRRIEDLIPGRFSAGHKGHRDGYFDDPRTRPMGIGLELFGLRADGSEFPADVSLTTVDAASGVIASAAIRDVTDRVERAREQRELEDQALEARMQQSRRLESVGELAGGIAHDFNNLLAVILNNAELALEDTLVDGETREEIEEILGVAERGAKLTRQLLIFSRAQDTPRELVDLNEVLGDLNQLLVRTLGEHIRLEMKLESGLPLVMADACQVEQVVLNLAINARDAMHEGGSLVIETKTVDLEDEYARTRPDVVPGLHVRLSVVDEGVGMSPDVIARAMEPFFTMKPRGEGAGLGLATVYGIVKRSDGHIGIYSEEGTGTVIRVHLPIGADQAGGLRSHLAAPFEPLPGAGRAVMVIEDSDEVRRTLRRILQPRGYVVIECAVPSEALSISADMDRRIDVVLTDVVMPEMLGTEVAKRIKAMRPDVPVLFMSGYAEGAAPMGDLESLIEKPFTTAKLLTHLQEALAAADEQAAQNN